ncbi:MAG: hypothetical protein GVY16_06215 [Planctomycetes bacterium]|jgi:hypothetical protein|nr:hypothetical protein [Phycisphaerae bacterium]NBB95318.1 hypothetical protein [Planctomycetota bacterium]
MPHELPPDGIYLPDDEPGEEIAAPDDPRAEALVAEAVELAAAVLDIAADYNIRHMSPNDLAEMSRRLYDAGGIGLAEHAVMSFQPHLLADYNAAAGLYRQLRLRPDTPRDLLAEWREHLRVLAASHADPATVAVTAAIAELLESFQPLDTDDR